MIPAERIDKALHEAARYLAEKIRPEGYWEGRLSPSALSTATAISALAPAGRASDEPLITSGLAWLERTQNADGGWGDTPDSPGNLSTTLLAMCAFRIARERGFAESKAIGRADDYVAARAGRSAPERLEAIRGIYGADRTFAVPILMNCALAGLAPWETVPSLPFELALLPRAFYKTLRLHVVSYALPALIAIGALIHARNPATNPLARALRDRALRRALGMLAGLQPASGGFLEATPLTSFVGMSLVALCGAEHPVAAKCLDFLRASAREDGSWPIDSNLAVWVTTGAVGALTRAGALEMIDAKRVGDWIEERQWLVTHPFTGAAPGGFAWTHLSGGVPDADDTAGAILALIQMNQKKETLAGAVGWLLDLQNADGGWPTFCRGWGKLPFDRSAPDLTAHVLRALMDARNVLQNEMGSRIDRAIARGFGFLERTQRPDGAWVPLWFGNQHAPAHENPVLGTARVLVAWACRNRTAPAARRGAEYLARTQNPDGGWGGAIEIASTIEETALAVTALTDFADFEDSAKALERGTGYLVERVESGTWMQTAPIGLYFSSLWYSEAMYPAIWTVEALGAARQWSAKQPIPLRQTGESIRFES